MLKNNNNNHSGCFSKDDLIAYLYDEITSAERGRLDVHLAECRTCTEDFASVSESRFSVYEWQRNDFAPLQTPVITGPWDNPSVRQAHSLAEPLSVSWIERIVALVGTYRSWALAVAAVGVVAFAVWFGLFGLRGSTGQDQAPQAEMNTVNPAVVPASTENSPTRQIAEVNNEAPKKDVSNVPVRVSDRRPAGPNPVAVADNNQIRRHHQNPVDLNGRKSQVASVRKAPSLSGIEEDEDRSVRLADLFAEVGSENEDN